MAGEIEAFILTFAVGAMIVLPVLTLLFLRDRLPFPIHKKYRLMVYSLPEGMKPDYSSMDNFQAQLAEHGYVRKEFSFWRIKEKGIPWFFVRRYLILGFKLDYKWMACVRTIAGQATLRVFEDKQDVWEEKNFTPIDLPQKMNPKEFEADISKLEEESNQAATLELSRPKVSDFWTNIILPLAIIGFFVIGLFLFYIHVENLTKITMDPINAYAHAVKQSQDNVYFSNCLLLKKQYGVDCEVEKARLANQTVPAAVQAGSPLTFK